MKPAQESGEAARTLDVDIVEFERLREEIDNRTQISNNLIVAYITALGAGFAFFDKVGEDLFLGLAAISIFLWLMWIDHTAQIYKIGSYIGRRLAKRISETHPEGFGWEKYLRVIDPGGSEATRELYGREVKERTLPSMGTRNISSYIMLLFGVPAPLLIVMYFLHLLSKHGESYRTFIGGVMASSPLGSLDVNGLFRLVAFAAVLSLYIYSLKGYWKFKGWISVIEDSLREPAADAEGDAPAAPSLNPAPRNTTIAPAAGDDKPHPPTNRKRDKSTAGGGN